MDLDATESGSAQSLQSGKDQLLPIKGCATPNYQRRMGLIFEMRQCAFVMCDEEFSVSNERKIFCSDRCRGRHHALINGEEAEMIRIENNMIIANYRILKAQRVGRVFRRTELRLLGYDLEYCSRYTINRAAGDTVTLWCYDLGLKVSETGYQLVSD